MLSISEPCQRDDSEILSCEEGRGYDGQMLSSVHGTISEELRSSLDTPLLTVSLGARS